MCQVRNIIFTPSIDRFVVGNYFNMLIYSEVAQYRNNALLNAYNACYR